MAVGDAAKARGYPIVPGTGEDGKVRYGAREINKTRDMVADLQTKIAGYGSEAPSNANGSDGDMYFQVI